MIHYFLSISLLSGSIIAYEITLMRLFSIGQWHHFAYMIISLALLGFGASGSVIFLTQSWLMRRFQRMYSISGLIYSISVPCCFALNQYVPFNPFMLIWQPSQILPLLVQYLILSIPFFFGAVCIGMALLQFKHHVNRIYFFDLLGSGIGAFGIVFCMYVVAPAQNLTVISAIGICGVLISNLGELRTHWRQISLIAVSGVLFIGCLLLKPISIKVSPYKGLSATLNFPDAEILSDAYSPLGALHVVQSESIRSAPGLSLTSQHPIPPQLGVFTDADGMTAITNFGGDLSKLVYLDDTSSALAYHLLDNPHVLVLGAGGGGDVLNAVYHKAGSVDAVELNPLVIDLIEQAHGDFSGSIYALDSAYSVRVHIAEARGFVRSTAEKYDLIQIALLDSVNASAAGTHTLSESYLYTVEAISELFQHLKPNGIVSITRWLKTPPRDMIKLFATAVEALERNDEERPAENLVMIRGWRMGTLLIKNGRFQLHERAIIRNFCSTRSFDAAYYPHMEASEANRYNQLAEPFYFRAARTILFGDREGFYKQYPFHVRPATDNRPYFFRFLRFDTLFQMIRTIGRNSIPFIEWGYLLLIATLLQAVLVGFILIFLPLLFVRRQSTDVPQRSDPNSRTLTDGEPRSVRYRNVLGYFFCLGVGFMFIEMAFIQKFLLLLSYPTYAVAVVLCAFLIFAGLGSLSSLRFRDMLVRSRETSPLRRPIPLAIGVLSTITLLYLLLLNPIFHRFLASSDPIKIIVSISLIAPLAFFMGMPFPLGIDLLRRRNPHLIAWAWAINGYASVVSAILATCLAISFGFSVVILLAIGIYLAGAAIVPR